MIDHLDWMEANGAFDDGDTAEEPPEDWEYQQMLDAQLDEYWDRRYEEMIAGERDN